jgi:hypothetical protein
MEQRRGGRREDFRRMNKKVGGEGKGEREKRLERKEE